MIIPSVDEPFESLARPGPLADDWPGASIDRFTDDGYTVIPGLFGAVEIGEIRRVIDGLFEDYERLPAGHCYDLDGRPSGGGVGKIPAIRNILQLRPKLREASGLASSIAWAERLIGGGNEVLWDAAIYKPAGSSSETPWHQDEAVYPLSRLRKPRSLVYFWVALDAVDEASGCIQFVPGSQRGPLLSHSWRHGDSTSSLLVDDAIEATAGVSVPLGPGDATVHHPRTLHGSGPNRSDCTRKAWILGIGRPSSPSWARRLKRRLLSIAGPFHGH